MEQYNSGMAIMVGLVSGFVGFFIATYIYWEQEAQKPLMCPRKAPCETVITSPQAKTFGISNALLGMMYYTAILFLLTCLAMGGESIITEIILLIFTAIGFLFSGYLVWVQRYKIKQWCVWCLGSAATATILFLVAILAFL